jgi:hypothetical protein
LAALFLRVDLRFLVAAAFLPAAFLRAEVRFLVAAAFLPAATRFVDFLRAGLRAVDFFAVDFLRAGFRVAVFLRAGLRAAVFFAAVFLRAGLRAAVFFAAVFLRAGLRAAVFFAAGLFLAAVLRAAIPVPLSSVVTKGLGLRRHPFEAPSFPFAHPAPNAVPLVAAKRVVEALDPNRALRADAFGLPRRSPLFGEEDLRIVVPTPRPFLPWDVVMHAALPPKSHTCDSEGRTASLARGNFR